MQKTRSYREEEKIDILDPMLIWIGVGVTTAVFLILISGILPYALYGIINFLIFLGSILLGIKFVVNLKGSGVFLCLLILPITIFFNPIYTVATTRSDWVDLDIISIILVIITGGILHLITHIRDKKKNKTRR